MTYLSPAKQREIINAQIRYVESLKNNEEAKHISELLKATMAYPAYVRIAASSDFEINEYKKAKLEELNQKLKQKKIDLEEKERLYASETQKQTDFYYNERNSQQNNENKNQFFVNMQILTLNYNSITKRISKEINSINSEIDFLQINTASRIRENMKFDARVRYLTSILNLPEDQSIQLASNKSIIKDLSKFRQLLNASSYYKKANEEKNKMDNLPSEWIIPENLPSFIKNKLGIFENDKSDIFKAKNILEFMEDMLKQYKDFKNITVSRFNEDDLKHIPKNSNEIDSITVNKYKDLYDKSLSDQYFSLRKQYDNMANSRITPSKRSFDEINMELDKVKNRIYHGIINWYRNAVFEYKDLTGREIYHQITDESKNAVSINNDPNKKKIYKEPGPHMDDIIQCIKVYIKHLQDLKHDFYSIYVAIENRINGIIKQTALMYDEKIDDNNPLIQDLIMKQINRVSYSDELLDTINKSAYDEVKQYQSEETSIADLQDLLKKAQR